MENTQSVKKRFHTLVSFLLMFAILLSSGPTVTVHAANSPFIGIADKEVIEHTEFDLLKGVSALSADGAELSVKITGLTCSTDPNLTYQDQPILTVGPAGTIYKVEYTAYSEDGAVQFTAERKITSIKDPAAEESTEQPPATEESNKETTPSVPEGEGSGSTDPSDSTKPSTAPDGDSSTQPSTAPDGDSSTQPSTAPDGDGSTQPSTAPDGDGSTQPSTAPDGDNSTQPSTAPEGEDSTTPSTEPGEETESTEDPLDPTAETTPEDETAAEEDPAETLKETGLPIIFENGLHYVVDPDYPNERIILYCMNNKLAWPHSTGAHPNVPEYSEGYLTPDMFSSEAEYHACMQKLRKLLFAGYPYNGERLYKLVPDGETHKPTVQEFNNMLILPPQLSADFPYLTHHRFTIDDRSNPQHFHDLLTFVGEVTRLFPSGVTANGLSYTDIISMPFYKAANALTFSGEKPSEDDVLNNFAGLYSSSYFVTDAQAYDATQLAVWRLLNEYGIENNDIQSLEHNELAKVLWQYCQTGDLLDHEPSSNEIWVEGDLTFYYHPKDGMWHSGKLMIKEPDNYNGLYHLVLPQGFTAICDGLNHVYSNEEYELVSDHPPKEDEQFRIWSNIDWLQDMRQYSPIGDPAFQHMVGAVIRKTAIGQTLKCEYEETGELQISKAVIGNEADQQKTFQFVLELSEKDFNGMYGDLIFQNGRAEFELQHGQTVCAKHLPKGATYKITEITPDDYQCHAFQAEGTITGNIPIHVSFENTKLNTLLLRKTVGGEMGDKTKKFTFTIEVKDSTGKHLNGEFPYVGSVIPGFEKQSQAPADGILTLTEGRGTLQLSHGQQIEIKKLPYLSAYTVTENEANQNGYTTTYSGEAGTLDTSKEVSVQNVKEYIPETGIRDQGGTGVFLFFAAAGLSLPLLYEALRRKRRYSR